MTKNQIKPVIIVGGGLAGLSAASYLNECGVDFILFEAGESLAGLAKSFKDDQGFSYDFGAHFVTNRLTDAIGVTDECLDVPKYGEAVSLKGKSYNYPFGLILSPSFAFSAVVAKLKCHFSATLPDSASDWYRASYGNKLAEEVAIPLTEAWSGIPGDELSSAVGDSIPGSIVKTLYLKLCAKVLRKAICSGYSRELPEGTDVWHVYPEKGIGVLCEKLAQDFQNKIKLGSRVEKILVEDEKVVGVIANGKEYRASAVVSTAPVHVLPKIIEGSDTLNYLSEFRYRPMTFVNLKLEGRELLKDVVVWTPEEEFPFFRLTETARSMPWLAPEGKTIITADIGCDTGDDIWKADDDELAKKCLDALKTLIPDVEGRYLGCNVLRTPLAYPIFAKAYERNRLKFEEGTGIDGLHSIGRNGEFRHVFMEDAYVRSRLKMHDLVNSLGIEAVDPGLPNAGEVKIFSRKESAAFTQALTFTLMALVGVFLLELVSFLSIELLIINLDWSFVSKFLFSLITSLLLVSLATWFYFRRIFD